ncbi:MAG TPA: FecR domain-containing protein [Mucilaginibacter sp.]|jgi:transmembrane sensor|nr:FecR domain-containing protein [Mucilaginibacter sp.]
MEKARLHRLLRQYLNNTINGADCSELLSYLKNTNPEEIEDIIDEELFSLDEGPAFKGKRSDEVLNRIKTDARFSQNHEEVEVFQLKHKKIYQKSWLQIAAALLIFFSAGLATFRYYSSRKTSAQVVVDHSSSTIVPGGNKATLTMANGRVIVLNNAANGLLAKAGASKITKSNDGQIIYNAPYHADSAPIEDNVLTTPKGGEYQVVLPDGTKVWLNSASSLSYPVAFTGNERHVKLTGEAYFEVAKNKEKPFYVSINNLQVKVLGTHFNISAYSDDDAVTATLLEGSVQVTKNKSQSLLKPGEQAVINYKSDNIMVSAADVDDAMAWKNGYFIFNDDNIEGIMKKVSRWYDVDISYKGNFDTQKFGGTFYRKKSITELLQHLEKIGGIHFTITGRRITVMN